MKTPCFPIVVLHNVLALTALAMMRPRWAPDWLKSIAMRMYPGACYMWPWEKS